MKTNDFDLGQNDKSTGGKFFLSMKSGFKVERRRKKSIKSREKNFKFFFAYALLHGKKKCQ